jgi:hypothetical protein
MKEGDIMDKEILLNTLPNIGRDNSEIVIRVLDDKGKETIALSNDLEIFMDRGRIIISGIKTNIPDIS